MELIRTPDERLEALAAFLRVLREGPVSNDTHKRYSHVLATATSYEVNGAIHAVLESAPDTASWEAPVARFLRSVSASLDRESLPDYPPGHPLRLLLEENAAAAGALDRLAEAVKGSPDKPLKLLKKELEGLEVLKSHYENLQNGLFPLYEEAFAAHACVRLMWTLQDKVLALRKSLLSLPDSTPVSSGSGAVKALGTLFTLGKNLAWREERILYPVSWRVISPGLFGALDGRTGSETKRPGTREGDRQRPAFSCGTGSLSGEVLEALFNALPVDVSFIDADDRVAFFSDPPGRIFPRSPAVIGRRVQNCHPPKSVATVEKILESFRSGERDREEFWLSSGERFVHISYAALRSPGGDYLGTLEISQDAAPLRKLSGEKRLL